MPTAATMNTTPAAFDPYCHVRPVYDALPAVRLEFTSVWADNMKEEFKRIRQIARSCTLAAFDTEFPGVLYKPAFHYSLLTADDRYFLLKNNVNLLNMIQLGLTLCDQSGSCYSWEFNFRFNKESDLRDPDSIKFLESNGIDFEANKKRGIDIKEFGPELKKCGLLKNRKINWVSFYGPYDFGYLLKAVTPDAQLPATLMEFQKLVLYYFGYKVFDVKYMIKYCAGGNLYGGLDSVAKALQVPRLVGRSHQAGSDSLLTLWAFSRMVHLYFPNDDCRPELSYERHAGVICGLEVC